MQDVLHVLSPRGIFLFVSPSVQELTGYTSEELVGKGITDFIYKDDVETFVKDFTTSINNDLPLTTYFRFKKKPGTSGGSGSGGSSSMSEDKSGSDDMRKPSGVSSSTKHAGGASHTILFEVTGQPYFANDKSPIPASALVNPKKASDDNQPLKMAIDSVNPALSLANDPNIRGCKCFFAMARHYPSKNNAMLDSFLELKVENEKLRQKLSEVYKEIEGEYPNESIFQAQGIPFDQQQALMNSMYGSTAGLATGIPDGSGGDGNRQISGFPTRMQGQFAQQFTDGSNPSLYYTYPTSAAVDPSNPYAFHHQQTASVQQQASFEAVSSPRGTAVDQNNMLVSSAGLIPSNSNTYGALGIGISSSARNASHHQSSQVDAGDGADGDKKKKVSRAGGRGGSFIMEAWA